MSKVSKVLVFSAIVCGSVIVSSGANAATYLISYAGQMKNGTDATGVFYLPNTNLTGKDFTLQYTLTYPGVGNVDANTATQLALSGGSVVGAASPLVARLTLNGKTETITGTREARFERLNSPSLDLVNEFVEDFDQTGDLRRNVGVITAYYGNTNLLSSVTPGSQINFANGAGLTIRASFSIVDALQVSPTFQLVTREAAGEFFIRSATQRLVDPAPGVPEPASWAMLIAGFGIVGSTARRRMKMTVIYAQT